MPGTKNFRLSRRAFCGSFVLAAAAAVPGLAPRSVLADTRVDEGEATAVSLGYRHDANRVDTEAFPKRAGAQGAHQFCDNCAMFQGESGDRWAPCSLFGNREVAGKGWCNAWVSRS